jgi:hypothetical protein
VAGKDFLSDRYEVFNGIFMECFEGEALKIFVTAQRLVGNYRIFSPMAEQVQIFHKIQSE